MLACTISVVTFVLAGFPDPNNVENFSFFRKFVDGFYESMSGFTTTGSSILNDVEAFPRGLLMWRSVTHLLGGMGIAYIGLTILLENGSLVTMLGQTQKYWQHEIPKMAAIKNPRISLTFRMMKEKTQYNMTPKTASPANPKPENQEFDCITQI